MKTFIIILDDSFEYGLYPTFKEWKHVPYNSISVYLKRVYILPLRNENLPVHSFLAGVFLVYILPLRNENHTSAIQANLLR